MPSYRRDRPESGPRPGPSRFRREEPERPEPEEERGFRRPSFLRREGAPSEFASRPVGPAERRELWEVLVPQSEREDPYFDYDKVFEVLRPRRAGGPSAAPPPVPPPREGPSRGEPTRRNVLVDSRIAEAMGTLDVHRIWDAVLALKADPRFRQGNPVAIVRIARQTELPQIFGLAPSDMNAFLEGWAYEVNAIRPRDLRGIFNFQSGKDGFVWLAYVE